MQQKMTGINNLRTSQKMRLRAMPKQVGQEFLDMYLQQKRQERHERECENMETRKEFVALDQKLMLKDMQRIQQKLGQVLEAQLPANAHGTPKPGAGKAKKLPRSMKKMDLPY